MKFDWDDAKEEANRKKHRIDFRTAAKVFLDPFVVEFDDRDPSGEMRFNAIGIVDGRMLFDPGRPDPHHFGQRGRAA
jgi:uncharacterized DUF497 family protein